METATINALDTVKTMYDAFGKGDVTSVLEHIPEHLPGRIPVILPLFLLVENLKAGKECFIFFSSLAETPKLPLSELKTSLRLRRLFEPRCHGGH